MTFVAAFGQELGFAPSLWVRMVVNVVMVIPLSLAGLGIGEAGFVLLLGPFAAAGRPAAARPERPGPRLQLQGNPEPRTTFCPPEQRRVQCTMSSMSSG